MTDFVRSSLLNYLKIYYSCLPQDATDKGKPKQAGKRQGIFGTTVAW